MTTPAEGELRKVLAGRSIPVDDFRKFGNSDIFIQDLLAWHHRWSGRPSREQLIKLYYTMSNDVSDFSYRYKSGEIPDAILALYPQATSPQEPERKKVSREEIKKVLREHNLYEEISSFHENVNDKVADDLLALLNGEERDWCSHVKWNGDGWTWVMPGWKTPMHLDADICPVAGCHAPRPKREGE